MGRLISDKFAAWQEECEQRFQQLKANEEELNRIFIDIYGLQDELTPEVEDKDVTVRRADLTREIKSLLSYAVGCLFGRYSLDVDGLVYAGGEWDDSKYVTLKPVTDNVLPLCDEEYFGENDLVNRIVEFVRVVYGADTLEENLAFIAKALGNKGNTSREIIRNYFLKDFFADHCKIYQKRPIYWMFDSGKKNGFKALVYLHRWDADTTGRVYNNYLSPLLRTYAQQIVQENNVISSSNDARTENEVFSACEEAVEELYKEIRRLTDNANIRHFIVTADHGFLYKHDPIMESDKVINLPQAVIKNKRFIISDDTQPVVGAVGYRLGDVLDTADDRTAYTPLGSSIFKCAGGGQNYVHGGASVQEMLVPVLDVRTQAGHVETQKATVSLLPTPETLMDGKITLKFLQTELVTDTVLPASYEVFAVNAMDNQVSTKRTIRADKTAGCVDEERRTEVTLTLKKLPYSRENDYYFLLTDKDTGAVMEKRPVKIDIAGVKKEE